MVLIGCLATEGYYVDHMASIWLALPKNRRGPFLVSQKAKPTAVARGIPFNAIKVFRHIGNKRATAHEVKKVMGRHPSEVALLTASWGNWRIVDKISGIAGNPYIPHGQGGPGPAASNGNWTSVAERLDLMLVPSRYGATELDGVNTVIINGQPKLDRWFGFKPPHSEVPIVAISFRWRDTHSAVDHYTPWLAGVKRQADASGVHLLGHGHPLKFDTKFKQLWADHGIESTPSFEEVLKRAHVYAADCSSSSFEFVGLDRPVVFLSSPHYESMHFAPRFTLGPKAGIINEHPQHLIADVLRAYLDPPVLARMRRDVAAIMFEDFKGEASLNAANALLDFYT